MGSEQLTGVVLFAVGALFVVFRRLVGTAWSRLGQFIWSRARLPWWAPFTRREILRVYDEEEAPNVGLFIGSLLAVTGLVLIFLPWLVG